MIQVAAAKAANHSLQMNSPLFTGLFMGLICFIYCISELCLLAQAAAAADIRGIHRLAGTGASPPWSTDRGLALAGAGLASAH
jgi:hypothetical protein